MSVPLDYEKEAREVKELGDEIGYGHLMSLASALWRKKLIAEYASAPDGAFIPAIKIGKKIMPCADLEQYDKIVKDI